MPNPELNPTVLPWVRSLALAGLLGLILMTTACSTSSRQVSGEPPAVTLDSIRIDGPILEVRVRLSNVNDASIRLDGLQLQLSLADHPALMSRGPSTSLNIAARGREPLEFVLPWTPEVRASLDRLSAGRVDRLPFELQLFEESSRELSVIGGFVHAVPGQVGRFR